MLSFNLCFWLTVCGGVFGPICKTPRTTSSSIIIVRLLALLIVEQARNAVICYFVPRIKSTRPQNRALHTCTRISYRAPHFFQIFFQCFWVGTHVFITTPQKQQKTGHYFCTRTRTHIISRIAPLTRSILFSLPPFTHDSCQPPAFSYQPLVLCGALRAPSPRCKERRV